jgi:hypothetical protein
MATETHVDRALERVGSEREALAAKLDAYGAFVDRVEDLAVESRPLAQRGVVTTTGTGLHAGGPTNGQCRAVRTAFAETIRPHSVEDVEEAEPLLTTIGHELTESIAVALAPTTDAGLTDELKRTVLSEVEARRTETEVLSRALEREASRLAAAGDTVDTITGWIVEADETPLTDLEFDALERRHRTLEDFRARCDDRAASRQEFLQRSTSQRLEAGIRHTDFVEYLYEGFPTTHPVLTTLARLDATCATCQRAVRDHLVRRV